MIRTEVDPHAGRSSGPMSRFDFRRPNVFGRDAIRSLEVAHEIFTRRLSSSWGSALRALVQLEPLGIDQISYDDYIRSQPNPNVLATLGAPPLPGVILVEMNVQLALQLVDRLLGGRAETSGRTPTLRRPTDLETALLNNLMRHGVSAIDETLSPFVELQTELYGVEFNPQLVQVATPSDMMVLLSYRVTTTQGVSAEGLITVCYPAKMLAPILERITAQDGQAPERDQAALEAGRSAITWRLQDVDVQLSVRLAESRIRTDDLASLQVGDVLRLDHRTDQPVRARVGELDVAEGYVGRRGRRLALQVSSILASATRHEDPEPVVSEATAEPELQRSIA